MNILIVAIDHGLQLERHPSDSAQLAAQKDQLEALLKREIQKRKIGFISEESDPNKKTIARTLAESGQPTIQWKNIMMSEKERESAGIKEALKNRPGHPDYKTMSFWVEIRIPEDVVIESFFIEQTLQTVNGTESILMLLGGAHVDAVAARLTKKGHQVETNHELLPVKRWEEIADRT